MAVSILASCYSDPPQEHPCDECAPCEACVEGVAGPTCAATSHASSACGDDGDVHWLDSCGVVEDVMTECPAGQGQCVATVEGAVCDCLEHWEGDDCGACPENWDPDQGCAACLNQWVDEGNDCGTCPGNWDPEQDCAACMGNWDVAAGCAACLNQWVDEGNDCGTCPGNWDPEQDCATCANEWTGADCGTCPGNWDPDADCADCLGNWDPAQDCAACESYWDPATACTSCLEGWTGDDCDVGIRYADAASAAGTPDGTSWDTAFARLQDAVDACRDLVMDDAVASACEVWAAAGVYYVFETSRSNTLSLRANVALYGGFGGGEDSRDERDYEANVTVIDGLEAGGSLNVVYHVITGADDAVLDGFTIRNGKADGDPDTPEGNGGGMRNVGVSPAVRNCSFSENSASYGGGAVLNVNSAAVFKRCEFVDNDSGNGAAVGNSASSAIFDDCRFEGNSSPTGAMSNENSPVTVRDCDFEANDSSEYGGAINNSGSDAVIESSVFRGNMAFYSGGAVINSGGAPQFRNCVFTQNIAGMSGLGEIVGGAIYNLNSEIDIAHCVFFGNEASDGGTAIYTKYSADTTISNSVFWNDSFGSELSTTDISFCVISELVGGDGNIDADPLFVGAASGDFRLQAGSPCIDAADGAHATELDIDGNARVDDPDVENTGINDPPYADIGAYERQP